MKRVAFVGLMTLALVGHLGLAAAAGAGPGSVSARSWTASQRCSMTPRSGGRSETRSDRPECGRSSMTRSTSRRWAGRRSALTGRR